MNNETNIPQKEEVKNNRNLVIGGVIAAAILSIGMLTSSYAFTPNEQNPNGDEGCARGPHMEMREEVEDALENDDYNAWADAMANHPKAEGLINEDTFNTLKQAHALHEAGDDEGAKALLDDAGIKPMGERGGMHEEMSAAHDALENNDYNAWAEAMANHPNAEEFVNENTFNTLQEAQALREAGDNEGAKALLEDAGIKLPQKGQHMKGKGGFRGMPGQQAEQK